jgi:hypothetical protein
MTEYAIAASRERLPNGHLGPRVVIETMLRDSEYTGTVNFSYLDAEAAIRFGDAVAAMGRAAMSAGKVP